MLIPPCVGLGTAMMRMWGHILFDMPHMCNEQGVSCRVEPVGRYRPDRECVFSIC
jgi:hypothetical protein